MVARSVKNGSTWPKMSSGWETALGGSSGDASGESAPVLPAGEGKFEEGASCFDQAIGTAGQEIDLATPAADPCANPR